MASTSDFFSKFRSKPVSSGSAPQFFVGLSALPKGAGAAALSRKDRRDILIETSKREAELPVLTMLKSSTTLYSYEDMVKIAGSVVINNIALIGRGSVNDERMGVVSTTVACQQCGLIDCPGHYGLIQLPRPIYNPAYITEIVHVLTAVCNDCGSLLITEDIIREKGFMSMKFEKRLAAIKDYVKGDIVCLKQNPQIGTGKITPCTRNPIFVTLELKEKGEITYKIPSSENKKVTKDDAANVMPIDKVRVILDMISEKDAELLGFSKGNHPRNMILRGILVPPVIARPPNYVAGAMQFDHLTSMYVAILKKVIELNTGKKEATKDLYDKVRQLIFKSDGKLSHMQQFISIVERIQGKAALLRALLMGKRNDQCGRTVAGPDATLKYGQIRIPEVWAKFLTKKVKVTEFNYDYLNNLLVEGKITHFTSHRIGLRQFNDPARKYILEIGDIVERWLENGDRITVNRQPTLHRQSLMGYTVVLGYQLTIGLHLSYTTPMNCDFDGDENNAWNPQDFEVEAEVDTLLDVKQNIMSSEQNMPIMGLVMNSITGVYLMTDDSTMIRKSLYDELLSFITNKQDLVSLNERLKKYGVKPYSGKSLFSAMLPVDFNYDNKGVTIMEGVLISGKLTKSHVGTKHRSIIQELWKKYGSQRTADFFTDAPRIINKWLIERGFTVGIADMINLAIDANGEEYDKNKRILENELAKIYVQIEALGGKLDDPMEEVYRQKLIGNYVNIADGIGLRLAQEVLSKNNAIGVMTDQGSGAKGGIANIGQMMGSVGQQFYRGARLAPTLSRGKRLLPAYDYEDNNPEANGFIPVSFYTGLSPEALFFLQAGGREGILDTALKTAETGYMQHRMIKAFENIVIGYDGSIRNTIGTMFAPMYNSGYDIGEMLAVKDDMKAEMSSFIDILSLVSDLNIERGWVKKNANEEITKNRNVNYQGEKSCFKPSVTEKTYDIDTPVDKSYKITKFEKARIIGTRAMQLSNNAPPLIDIGEEIDPLNIAKREYELGILQLYIIRKFPDGTIQKIYPTLENI